MLKALLQDSFPPPEGFPSARSAGGGRWLDFQRPVGVKIARRLEEVRPLLEEVEAATAEGLWAVGFLAYESGPAFDDALDAHPAPEDGPPPCLL
ncbi:MAG: hypothetical protein AAGN66_17965, partial [Acidobacteriota bacterium]